MSKANIYKEIKLLDSIGIRVLPTYAANGMFGVVIRHKKEAPKSDSDWKMERIGFLDSFDNREGALRFGIIEGQKIAQELDFLRPPTNECDI